jgi:hypothetical protein
MPIKKATHQMSHYLPLYAILALGALGILYFNYDREFQKGIIIATSLSYITWGIVHHKIHNDLSFKIILEYTAIALLGMAILLSVFG